jgi:hypothetical protein
MYAGAAVRVTRLGEFSPIVHLTTWISFSKITEAAQIWGLFFTNGKICVPILTKNGLGYILGDFFTNSSGHPGRRFRLKSFSSRQEGLPDFSWYVIPKPEKMYVFPNVRKILQTVIKEINIFESKALEKLPKLGFFV